MAKKAVEVNNNGGQDLSPRFIHDDDRFLARLLSRERYNSAKKGGEEASFRVLYYGGTAGSVPFLWESRPGTPKHTFNDDALPPLTPPPSLHPGTPTGPSPRKKQRSSGFFYSVFLKLPSKKINNNASPAAALNGGEWEEAGGKSPTSTLCFGGGSGSPWRGGGRRRCSSPMKSVKKMVQSMVGQSESE